MCHPSNIPNSPLKNMWDIVCVKKKNITSGKNPPNIASTQILSIETKSMGHLRTEWQSCLAKLVLYKTAKHGMAVRSLVSHK